MGTAAAVVPYTEESDIGVEKRRGNRHLGVRYLELEHIVDSADKCIDSAPRTRAFAEHDASVASAVSVA